ncbi:MAG TPA: hypothetical protein DIS76_01640 [Rhodospirillaceae bacterium]|nr:hypothetical protein [Rhodospirillaceae bacterium]
MDIRPKISAHQPGQYLIDLGQEKQAVIGEQEITIWDMRLQEAPRLKYLTTDPAAIQKPRPDLRVEINPDLTKQQLFALHNKVAEVTAWWPIESDARPWEALFNKFITMVLYEGNQPVGIAHAIPPNENNEVELKYIGLIAKRIGQGYGEYFASFRMATLTKMFPDSDIILGTTSFDISPAKQKLALEFHQKMGFAVEGEPLVKTIMDTTQFYQTDFVKTRNAINYREAFHLKL